jgi:hypothetical protein
LFSNERVKKWNTIHKSQKSNNMKKVLFVLLALAMGAGTQSFAQEAPKTKKETLVWQKVYMDEAGIPADIQAKIDSIRGSYESRLKEIRKDNALPEETKKDKTKELNKQRSEEIFALLTKEQKEKIKTIRERLKKESDGS